MPDVHFPMDERRRIFPKLMALTAFNNRQFLYATRGEKQVVTSLSSDDVIVTNAYVSKNLLDDWIQGEEKDQSRNSHEDAGKKA